METELARNDNRRIALILVEALFFGDKRTAKRWNITPRTIRNYHALLHQDEELSSFFHVKCREFETNWAKDLPSAIIAGISFLKEAAHEADYKNPDAIMAISNAVKILAEVGLTKEIIDARLSGYDPGDRTQDKSIPAHIPE